MEWVKNYHFFDNNNDKVIKEMKTNAILRYELITTWHSGHIGKLKLYECLSCVAFILESLEGGVDLGHGSTCVWTATMYNKKSKYTTHGFNEVEKDWNAMVKNKIEKNINNCNSSLSHIIYENTD